MKLKDFVQKEEPLKKEEEGKKELSREKDENIIPSIKEKNEEVVSFIEEISTKESKEIKEVKKEIKKLKINFSLKADDNTPNSEEQSIAKKQSELKEQVITKEQEIKKQVITKKEIPELDKKIENDKTQAKNVKNNTTNKNSELKGSLDLEEMFLKSETSEENKSRWFETIEKAKTNKKNNYIFEKIKRGKFRINDLNKIEILPEFDTHGKNSKDLMNEPWNL